MIRRMLDRSIFPYRILVLSAGLLPAAGAQPSLPPFERGGQGGATSDVAPSDEFVQLIVKLIGDGDREFRAAGLEQVRTAARGTSLTRLFAAQLTKLDSSGQVALLGALADRGDVAARPAVLELYASSKDENVRAAAIGALGSLGGTDDLPLLIKALSATATTEQAAARKSLVHLPGETISKSLATESKTAPAAVKAALLEVLAT